MRTSKLGWVFGVAAALAISATSSAQRVRYSAVASDVQTSLSPSAITVYAYQAEDKVEIVPDHFDARISFTQDPDLREGDTALFRFGLVFDPDDSRWDDLQRAISRKLVTVPTTPRVDLSVSSLIGLPMTLQHFRHWCTRVGQSYAVEAAVWFAFDSIVSREPATKSVPLTINVRCRASKALPTISIDPALSPPPAPAKVPPMVSPPKPPR